MKWKRLYAAHEVRMWVKDIIMPFAVAIGVAMQNQTVRYYVVLVLSKIRTFVVTTTRKFLEKLKSLKKT